MDELDYGIAVHSTDKKTQCKNEAREAPKKRERPCGTSVVNSESGRVQPTALLHCNLTPGSVQPTAPLLCNLPVSWQTPTPVHAKSPPLAPPISWQTPAPIDSKSATWPLPSHGLHPPPFRPPPPKELEEMGAPPPPSITKRRMPRRSCICAHLCKAPWPMPALSAGAPRSHPPLKKAPQAQA